MIKTATLLTCISVAIIFCLVPVHAATLTFEDLTSVAHTHIYDGIIPNGYADLNWDNFGVADAPLYTTL